MKISEISSESFDSLDVFSNFWENAGRFCLRGGLSWSPAFLLWPMGFKLVSVSDTRLENRFPLNWEARHVFRGRCWYFGEKFSHVSLRKGSKLFFSSWNYKVFPRSHFRSAIFGFLRVNKNVTKKTIRFSKKWESNSKLNNFRTFRALFSPNRMWKSTKSLDFPLAAIPAREIAAEANIT